MAKAKLRKRSTQTPQETIVDRVPITDEDIARNENIFQQFSDIKDQIKEEDAPPEVQALRRQMQTLDQQNKTLASKVDKLTSILEKFLTDSNE